MNLRTNSKNITYFKLTYITAPINIYIYNNIIHFLKLLYYYINTPNRFILYIYLSNTTLNIQNNLTLYIYTNLIIYIFNQIYIYILVYIIKHFFLYFPILSQTFN